MKENTLKKVLKSFIAFTLSMAVALTTIFVGLPLNVKAADANNPNYIIGVADNHNWMGTVVDGQSNAISSKGVLLWPGEKVISNGRTFSEPNTTINCHHDSNAPSANRYSNYVGLNITSADKQVTLDTLGEWVSDEEEMITGGTVNDSSSITKGKLAYEKAFVAKKPVFLEYDDIICKAYATKCGCPANSDWNTYHYYLYSFKVHEISASDINIEYADTDSWKSDKTLNAIKVSKDKTTYSYQVPTKVGYAFDGWDFRDKKGSFNVEGNNLFDIIKDSKDGTLTVEGTDAKNCKTFDQLSRNGIVATPKWVKKKVTINYDPNGGVISSRKSVCITPVEDLGGFIQLDAKREGYSFDGWYVDNKKITSLEDIPAAKSNSSQIYDVKAKWTPGDNPSSYTIDSKTGTLTVKNQNSFPSYDYRLYVKRVVVSEGITEIPEGAFKSSALEEIKLPTTLKTIGKEAFMYCKNLEAITIPNGVTEIKEDCFNQCTKLKKVVLPSQLKSIGTEAFYMAPITSVSIPDSVTDIGDSAFAYTGLKSVEIPGKVTLGYGVFSGCKELESAKLNRGIKCIQNDTFSGCTSLKKLTLPNTIELIGWQAFADTIVSEVIFGGTKQQWEELCKQADELKAAKVTYVQSIDTHVHELKHVAKVAPTCTKPGNKEYWICTKCGKVYSDAAAKNETSIDKMKIAASGHKWNKGAVTKKPTATKTGAKTYKCTVCGATKTEVIPVDKPAKVGTKITDSKSKGIYIVTKSDSKNGTVAYKQATDKKQSSVKVPDSITYKGITYKVTAIKDYAFKGVSTKATIKVPKGKAKTYKSLFQKKGLSKKVIVK
ncbi:MAG: leucine-rich repeat domain-containing protein [Agathobacter sp.]|nr:leucine-rich repeat domain-containing protein [Agathobacter sp.]